MKRYHLTKVAILPVMGLILLANVLSGCGSGASVDTARTTGNAVTHIPPQAGLGVKKSLPVGGVVKLPN
jgi:hypothetical protein